MGIMKKAATVALSAAMLAGTAIAPAFAATNGSVGSTSTGSSTITVFVGSLVRVTAVDDLDLGAWSGTGDLVVADDVCIWTTTGGYNVTASGNGGTGTDFALTNGTESLTYAVKWGDSAGVATDNMTSGSPLGTQFSGANSTDCNGGANLTATVEVEILDADLSGADSGTYTGVLTLVIAPE
jgi:hypothetical protein